MRLRLAAIVGATAAATILLVTVPGAAGQEIPLPPVPQVTLPPLPGQLGPLVRPVTPLTNAACTVVAVALQDVGLVGDLLPTVLSLIGGPAGFHLTGLGPYLALLQTPCTTFPRPDAVTACKVDDDVASATKDLINKLVASSGAGQAGALVPLIGIPQVRAGVLIDTVIELQGLAAPGSDQGTSLGAVLYRELGCRNVLALVDQGPPSDPSFGKAAPPLIITSTPGGDGFLGPDLGGGPAELATAPPPAAVEPGPGFVPASVAHAAWTLARGLIAIGVALTLLVLSGLVPSRPRPL